MQTYFLGGENVPLLMNQTAVRSYRYPPRHTHNAIWDSTTGPDGKFYYALASEISTSNYVRFCRYDYKTDTAEELFKIEDVILPPERAIRPSKFHTSISFFKDGRAVMTTHTTDKSPRHPTWMPEAYYHHLYEAFPGGHIVLWDPKTNKAENLGLPVPQESIYGAALDEKHNALFFLGIFRGFLYRYSFDTHKVQCLGKVSPNYDFRLTMAADGHIYGSSRTGWLYRVNTDTLRIEDLNFQFPHAPYEYSARYNEITVAHTGPDGRLYMAVMYSKSFFALDPATGKVEDMGWYLPTDRYCEGENRHGVFGMDFDSKGVLWYAVTSLNNYEGNLEYGLPASLFRWDVARGGKPEWCGLIGTPDFGGAWVSELSISKDDVLYMANSNHSLDGPAVIGVDLEQFLPLREERTEKLLDKYMDPQDPGYIESGSQIHAEEKILGENPIAVPLKPLSPVHLWRELAPDHIEQSAVKGLFWADAETLCGVCGDCADREIGGPKAPAHPSGAPRWYFEITAGRLAKRIPVEEADPAAVAKALARPVAAAETANGLPHYPGRQYKAVPVASAPLCGGRELVGTLDGMLAIVKDGKAFSLGPAAFNGPIHQMAATPDGKTVYGVAGDEQDIAVLFRYDDENGLRWLGFLSNGVTPDVNDVFVCTIVRSLAISPDGKYLALGADERLGTVVVYTLDK